MQMAGQSGLSAYLDKLELNQALDPPQDILSSKSLVLISAPVEAAHAEWKKTTEEMQAFFGEVGIDAVAYFNLNRKFTIPGFEAEIPKLIADRNITNLIFLIVGNEEQESMIGFGAYNGKPGLYDRGTPFWTRSFTDIETVFEEMSLRFKTGAFPRTNLLVNDKPEFFDFTQPAFAANYASFPPELDKKSIGIPMLRSQSTAPGAQLLTANVFNNSTESDLTFEEKNNALEAVVLDSLMNIRRIDLTGTTEALLRRDGVTHLLYYVTGDSEYVYNLFRFKGREDVPANYLVKFFLKDLRNQNIFLGRSWDARSDWQSALDSFMAQIEKELANQAN